MLNETGAFLKEDINTFLGNSLIENWIFIYVLLFSCFHFAWLMYLEFRQQRCIVNDDILQEYELVVKEYFNCLSKDKLSQMKRYCLAKLYIRCIDRILTQVLSILLMFCIGVAWEETSKISPSELFRSLFLVIFMVIIPYLIFIPTSKAEDHNEKRYGFRRKQTSLILSSIKQVIVELILKGGMVLIATSLSIKVLNWSGYFGFLVLWISILILQFVFLPIVIAYLLPMSKDFEELPEGSLKLAVEALAVKTDFPRNQIYVKITPGNDFHSNAYCFGLCCYKQIVIFDTTLEIPERKKLKKHKLTELKKFKSVSSEMKMSSFEGLHTEEILGVLSHELGHWKKKHVLKLFGILKQIQITILITLLGYLSSFDEIYACFGIRNGEKPIIIGLIMIYWFILAPVRVLFEFLLNALSRYYEYEADQYSSHLGHEAGLCKGLVQFYSDNLKYPFDDNLYCMWHFTHPSLIQRIEALKCYVREL